MGWFIYGFCLSTDEQLLSGDHRTVLWKLPCSGPEQLHLLCSLPYRWCIVRKCADHGKIAVRTVVLYHLEPCCSYFTWSIPVVNKSVPSKISSCPSIYGLLHYRRMLAVVRTDPRRADVLQRSVECTLPLFGWNVRPLAGDYAQSSWNGWCSGW